MEVEKPKGIMLFSPKGGNKTDPFTRLFDITECQELCFAYSGPAPMAYGTHTDAVFESVFRSYKYFNTDKASPEEWNLKVKTPMKTTEELNRKGPQTGFNYEVLMKMLNLIWRRKKGQIKQRLVLHVADKFYGTEYTELAKGKQTYSPFQERNVPAPEALKEFIEFLERNIGRVIPNRLSSILNSINEILSRKEILWPSHSQKGIKRKWKDLEEEEDEGDVSEESDEELDEDFIYEDGAKTYRNSKSYNKTWYKISNADAFKRLCSINSMWKHFERGKLKRRAIFSPTMMTRAYAKLIEDMSANLLETFDGAGLPIGGEEKLAKLASRLSMTMNDNSSGLHMTGEISGDETKFNECLDCDSMRMALCFFVRNSLGKSKETACLINHLETGFLIFKSKMVIVGPGLSMEREWAGKKQRKVFRYDEVKEKTEWKTINGLFEKDVCSNGALKSTLGMLMGMLNLSATMLALLPFEAGLLNGVDHIQSSDDYISFITAIGKKNVLIKAKEIAILQRFLGINNSEKKNILIVPGGIGEFNSKNHKENFVGNVATEIPAQIMGGKSPPVDWAMLLAVLKNGLLTCQMTPASVALALRMAFKMYRYTYMVDNVRGTRMDFIKSFNKQPKVMAHGAGLVHSVSTLGIDEIALRYHLNLITIDDLKLIINPNNPFSCPLDPTTTFTIESKLPMSVEIPCVGTMYHTEFSRNRSVLQSYKMKDLKEEADIKEICNFISEIVPIVKITSAGNHSKIKDVLRVQLEQMIELEDIPDVFKDELHSLLGEG